MTSEWRSRWLVTVAVAGDVTSRDGIGWEFATLRHEDVWAVFRDDSGPFPVFSASRGSEQLPPWDELEAMTHAAVADLLSAANVDDSDGWLARNISAALLIASCDIRTWEGLEWALESGDDDVALAWATDADGRTPFAWLRGKSVARDVVVDIYQDDGVFGLRFVPVVDQQLPESDDGSFRSRRDIPIVVGRINRVEAVVDTLVEGGSAPGLVTEVVLHGDTSSTLLMVAEAYSRDEWHLYDESVVVLADVAAADALDWIPARSMWRPAECPGR